ncbi:MAG: hypothetical protein JKY25_08515 [Robiginitomaculum sp.]|nr:hypothetical protein [Robiginitomaculum sp.]
MRSRKTILVVYYTRGVYPLRSTIETHLYALKRYSKHRVVYINIALGWPWDTIRSMSFDVIVFHTSFCGMRWGRDVFNKFTAIVREIGTYPALKIAMPQDEFIHTDMLSKIIDDFNVDIVLSCADESQWPIIYKNVKRNTVKYKTVLTGYIDEKVLRRIQSFHKPLAQRKWMISYRAWRAAYWLGEHGIQKVRIGEVFQKEARERNLAVDISLNDADTISGMDWLKFLANSRAVVGVEGGASIIDRDGRLKEKVENYLETHKNASFEEVQAACFMSQEGSLDLRALSPRHLEAAATKTCQILIEGHYNGVLRPWQHYIPVAPDYTNLDAVFEALLDDERVQTMVDRSYADIIETKKFTYRGFVGGIEKFCIDALEAKPAPVKDLFKRRVLNFKDWFNWRIIQAEVAYLKNPPRYRFLAILARPVYRFFERG